MELLKSHLYKQYDELQEYTQSSGCEEEYISQITKRIAELEKLISVLKNKQENKINNMEYPVEVLEIHCKLISGYPGYEQQVAEVRKAIQVLKNEEK